ncbi:hypothetical protein, partial [Paraburkholderia caribensis]|uniref:hypothetical protein n=1 Tax=Paraburkholderia caribensis TaxID=75105 RepID=UPI001ABB90DA
QAGYHRLDMKQILNFQFIGAHGLTPRKAKPFPLGQALRRLQQPFAVCTLALSVSLSSRLVVLNDRK